MAPYRHPCPAWPCPGPALPGCQRGARYRGRERRRQSSVVRRQSATPRPGRTVVAWAFLALAMAAPPSVLAKGCSRATTAASYTPSPTASPTASSEASSPTASSTASSTASPTAHSSSCRTVDVVHCYPAWCLCGELAPAPRGPGPNPSCATRPTPGLTPGPTSGPAPRPTAGTTPESTLGLTLGLTPGLTSAADPATGCPAGDRDLDMDELKVKDTAPPRALLYPALCALGSIGDSYPREYCTCTCTCTCTCSSGPRGVRELATAIIIMSRLWRYSAPRVRGREESYMSRKCRMEY